MILLFALGMLILSLATSGIKPYDRATWIMEVLPVVLAIPILWRTYRRFPLTPLLYGGIFLHALVLILGGAYSYARVPLGFEIADWLGSNAIPTTRSGIFSRDLSRR